MPDQVTFLNAFNLVQGHQFDGFVLSSVSSTHEQVVRWQEYQYQITLIFNKLPNVVGNYETLYYDLMSEITQEHIVKATRNYYKCNIDMPVHGNIIQNSNESFTFNLVGHSYRTRKPADS